MREARAMVKTERAEGNPPIRHGGRRGDRMFVGGGQRQTDNRRAVRNKIDELDNAAYLEGEALLDERQKHVARQIASDYRAQVFEYRRGRDDASEGDEAGPAVDQKPTSEEQAAPSL